LVVNETNHVVDDFIRGILEVFRGRVVRVHHALEGLGKQGLGARLVLHEIEHEHVVEVALHLLHVTEVSPIVKLCKLEHNLDYLRFVVSRETAVSLAVKNTLAALENEVGANRVLRAVQAEVEGLLLGQQNDSSVVVLFARGSVAVLFNGSLDVGPYIRRVVPVQVNDLFG